MSDRGLSMALRAIAKRLVPPVLLDIFRPNRPTWEGVYPHINAVPGAAVSRRGEGWRGSEVDPMAYADLPQEVLQEHSVLAIIAAAACRQTNGTLRVLDVGGGLGISYVHLRNTLPACAGLDYHVVELELVAAEGARLFADDRRIHFHHELPDDLPDLDIIHLTEVLEYIEDYAGLLRRLCAYHARWVLLVGLHAGPFATYATAEVNIPGATIPQWFFNQDEIIGQMREGGYTLAYSGGIFSTVDQRNFPEALRLPGNRPRVLLFRRE